MNFAARIRNTILPLIVIQAASGFGNGVGAFLISGSSLLGPNFAQHDRSTYNAKGAGCGCIVDKLNLGSKKLDEDEVDNDDVSMSAMDILRELDDTFNYEGRMNLVPGSEDFRFGFVSIVGAPNMGKSTLMNALLKEGEALWSCNIYQLNKITIN